MIIGKGGIYRLEADEGLEVESFEAPGPLKRFTCFCDTKDEPGDYEEIDVDARTKREARQIADAAIVQDYEPGLRVSKIEGPHLGMYL